jgi:dTDP-4-amino-4,6-dideoxygalactose transaminase
LVSPPWPLPAPAGNESLAAVTDPGPLVPVTRPALPDLDRLTELLREIWASGQVTNDGPVLHRLEAALQSQLGWQNVTALANGTLALQLACKSLGLDGEVIVPAFTFPATVQALLWSSLVPVKADIDPDHLNVDPGAVSAAITPRTTAIMAVHTFGMPADVLGLQKVADRHGLALIYDAAPAVGVRIGGQPITAFGDVSAVSFHATKVMHTLEGGAVATPHRWIAESVRRLRNFGLGASGPALAAGTNAKLNEVQAAVGLLVLEALDGEIARRGEAIAEYTAMLGDISGVRVLRPGPGVQSNNSYAVLRLRRDNQPMADEVQRRLLAAGISSRRYFDERFRVDLALAGADTPVADAATQDVLCVPLWGGIPPEILRRVGLIVETTMASPVPRRA